MHRRVNITLPEETLALLDRVAKGRSRSRLIDLAVRHFVESLGRKNLRERLEEGYRRRAKLSRSIAAEWFPLEEEAWERYGG
jgi:metal-responsive CopG/Arc/MetJ family transcriptional regulator